MFGQVRFLWRLMLLPLLAAYGGQAVMNGVMMRGTRSWAVAVNTFEAFTTFVYHHRAFTHGWVGRMPLLRGIAAFADAMLVGVQALLVSYRVIWDNMHGRIIEKPVRLPAWKLVAFALPSWLLSISIFKLVPALTTHLLSVQGDIAFAGIEAAIRVCTLLALMFLLGLTRDARDLFAYHGAEHQVIGAHEAGDALTSRSVGCYSVLHPRCGTAFLLWVAVVSFALYAFIGQLPLGWLLLSRVLCLPLIVGISYELVRFATARLGNPVIRVLVAPGLWLQRLTTRTPGFEHHHAAIRALRAVIVYEELICSVEDVEVLA